MAGAGRARPESVHGRPVLAAYRTTDGKQLWQFDAGTGIMAPPVSYLVDGIQYVSVMAGWGGGDGGFNDASLGKVKPGYGRIRRRERNPPSAPPALPPAASCRSARCYPGSPRAPPDSRPPARPQGWLWPARTGPAFSPGAG